jgi:hypothetical protein
MLAGATAQARWLAIPPHDSRCRYGSGDRPCWQRREQLHRLANNIRFLIMPWIMLTHLASHVFGAVARLINADWQDKYGHGLDWLETFVEQERFAETCYCVAIWQRTGQTTGRSRQDRDQTPRVPVKDVHLYGLGGRGS